MVHRDIRTLSKRLPSGPFVALANPGADHRGTRSVDNGLTGYREVTAGGGGTLAVPRRAEAADPKLRYAPLNQM
jgi:hypothetical protein